MAPTRLKLTYQTVSGDGGVARELPFVVAVIGDFAADARVAPDRSRHFVEIDVDSFDRVMADIGPQLILRLGVPALPEVISLSFSALDEFRPEALVDRIAALKQLRDERDRMTPVDAPTDQPATPETGGGSFPHQVVDQSEPAGSPGGVRPGPGPPGSRTREIDAVLAAHLDAILHDEKFQRLESLWRGLHHLVEHGGDRERVKIRLMAISKRDLRRAFEANFELAEHFFLYHEIYTVPMAPPGGEPYGAIVADYAFSARPVDLRLLDRLAQVAEIAHAPLLTAASPEILDPDWTDYSHLPGLRPGSGHFDAPVFTPWRSFREGDVSKYVYLTLPRIRGRPPFGTASNPVAGFNYVERTEDHGEFLWINAAHALARRLVDGFEKYGWCTVLDGDGDGTGAVEAELGDALPEVLDSQGFVCVQRRHPGEELFITTASVHQPARHQDDERTQTEYLAARLPYVMACARIAHYLMRIAGENRSYITSATELVELMNRWLASYTVPAEPEPGAESVYPLAHGVVELRNRGPGNPSVLMVHLRPVFQLDAAPLPTRFVIELGFEL